MKLILSFVLVRPTESLNQQNPDMNQKNPRTPEMNQKNQQKPDVYQKNQQKEATKKQGIMFIKNDIT